jgi:hypothetical protein
MSDPIIRWEHAPGGVKNGLLTDVPGLGRYLIKRTAPHSRTFRAYLNNRPTSYFSDTADDVKQAVERAIRQRAVERAGKLNEGAVRAHATGTPPQDRPNCEDLLLSIEALLMGGAPPWVQTVTRHGSALCVLTDGRVFEVTVR